MFIVSIILSIILMLILKFLIFDYETSYITEVIVYALFNTVISIVSLLVQTQTISIFIILGVFIIYSILGLLVILILRIISERLEGLAFIIIGLIMDSAVRFGVTFIIIILLAVFMTLNGSSQSLINY